MARPAADSRSLRELLRLAGSAWRLVAQADRPGLALIVCLQGVAGISLASQVVLVQRLLSELLGIDQGASVPAEVAWIVAGLAASFAAAGIAAALQRERSTLIGERVGLLAMDQLLDIAGSVELEAFEHPSFFDRLQRAQLNAASRHTSIVRAITGLLGSGIAVASVAVGLIVVAPVLSPFVVLAAIPAWIAGTRDARQLHRFSWDMAADDRERTYAANVLTQQAFAKEVRAFDLGGFFRSFHRERFERRTEALARVIRDRIRRAIVVGVIRAVVLAAAIGVVVKLVADAHLTLAQAGAALLALVLTTQRLGALVTSLASLHESALFVDDYFDFLTLPRAYEPDKGVEVEAPPFTKVDLVGVGYSYPGASVPAVSDVTLTVASDEVIALVGRNGSGKTTVAKLLCGLHSPSTGTIFWDGVDARSMSASAIRDRTTAIFQDFAKWNLSARLNIALGRVARRDDDDAVHDAARRAEADAILCRLDAGYETRLGRLFPDGIDLSIGQWQRVALARALFRDAPVVVMDEPTAALDPAVEYELFQTIRDRLRGRALVVISHRFANVRFADRIYVLDEGRIIEHGNHEELLRLGGEYARLFGLQRDSLLGDTDG